MQIATLGLPVRNTMVLLGEKKSGAEIGLGMLNGLGGKKEPGESIFSCLVREGIEEFDIRITEAEKVAILSCFEKGSGTYRLFQEVHVYLVTQWEGEPTETDSMFLPEWYSITDLPFERMHDADENWMESALRALGDKGTKFNARVYYRQPGTGFETIDFQVPFDDWSEG